MNKANDESRKHKVHPRKVKLLFKYGSDERVAISFQERSNGDVMVFYASEPDIRDSKTVSGLRVLRNVKYSVHKTLKNPDINVIKFSRDYMEGPPDTGVMHTSCIKKRFNFAPIFTRMFPNLSDSRFKVTQTKGIEFISIGNFYPAQGTAVSMVLVGHPEVNYKLPFERQSQIEICFSNFKFLVVTRLLPFSSPTTGSLLSFSTRDHKTSGGHIDWAKSLTLNQGGNPARMQELIDLNCDNFCNYLAGNYIPPDRAYVTFPKDPSGSLVEHRSDPTKKS